MASLPRLIVVDPTGEVQEQVRAALTLLDRLAIQIDVPGAGEAIEELKHSIPTVMITAWECGDDMRGWELAARVNRAAPDLPMIVLADYDDMLMDDDMLRDSPFIYLKRPYDVSQFLRVLLAILDGRDAREALLTPVMATAAGGTGTPNYGGVPQINVEQARPIIHKFMSDLNAMGVLLVTRDGKVLVEQGALGYLKRDELANALVGSSVTQLALREMLTGSPSLFQFYDGETYDMYVLSAGFHHLVVVLFDGQRGSRELGAVRSFGRRATEDVIAIIGAEALLMSLPVQPVVEEAPVPHRGRQRQNKTDEEIVAVVRADLISEPDQDEMDEMIMPMLDALEGDIDLDALFGDVAMDDNGLFNLDRLAQEMARLEDKSAGGKLDWDKAKELGLLGGE